MNATLRCRLLGSSLIGRFTVADPAANPQAVSISTRKGGALLAYLAMQPGHAATRRQLATLLWGNRSDELARQNLRQCLVTLHKELAAGGLDLLIIKNDNVTLRKQRILIDAVEFGALADAIELPQLERAVALYGGEFLKDTEIEAETFSEWVIVERTRLQAIAARVLERYVTKADAFGDGRAAISAGERLVGFDPLREDWQRSLLRLYARYQGREAAIAYARSLTTLLRNELDVDPSPATTELKGAGRHSGDRPASNFQRAMRRRGSFCFRSHRPNP
jgi:DNA-binding SARP family transcriptional activator